jgi:hypothetical protein
MTTVITAVCIILIAAMVIFRFWPQLKKLRPKAPSTSASSTTTAPQPVNPVIAKQRNGIKIVLLILATIIILFIILAICTMQIVKMEKDLIIQEKKVSAGQAKNTAPSAAKESAPAVMSERWKICQRQNYHNYSTGTQTRMACSDVDVTWINDGVKITQSYGHVTYEGKKQADGSYTGTWTQIDPPGEGEFTLNISPVGSINGNVSAKGGRNPKEIEMTRY